MRKAFIIAIGTIAVFISGVFAVWSWLFWTPSGRSSLTRLAETEIAKAVGGEVAISELSGAPPGEIILTDAAFAADRSQWLHIERAELHWRPIALLHGKLEARSIRISGATISGAPPKKPDETRRKREISLPDNLPNIRIAEIVLDDIRVTAALAGAEARLDGAGHVRTGGREIDIAFNATGDADKDFVSIRAIREEDALAVAATVNAEADGVIATLAQFGGPIFIELKGDGALSSYRLDFDAALGAYGVAQGSLAGDLGEMREIAFDAEARLGTRLANTSKIVGPRVQVAGEFRPGDSGGEISVARFAAALGEASGDIRWTNAAGALSRIDIDASAKLSATWRPDIRPYIGDEIAVKGELAPINGAFLISADVAASYFDGVLTSVESDLRDYARGPVSVTLKPNPNMTPLLASGGEARGEVELAFGERIETDAMTLTTAEGGAFSGAASYAFDTRAFAVKGDVIATSRMIASHEPRIASRKNASGVVDLKGDPDRFGGSLVASLPALSFAKAPFPATRLSIVFADAPDATAGQISLRAFDNSRRLTSNFARLPSGGWRVSGLDYAGEKFALKGSATLAGDETALDLAYRGVDGAEPWPGTPLVGDFIAQGSAGRGKTENSLTLASGFLSSRGWSASNLSASARGPSDRLSIAAAASRVDLNGVAPIEDISTEFTASLSDTLRLRATKLSADVGGAPAKLKQPADIVLGDGVAISGFRASIGKNGSLSFDGAVGNTRWRGKLLAQGAPIVSAASTIDLDIDLDTDRETPAHGAMRLSSLLTATDQARLSCKLVWNGETLSIRDDGSNERLDLDLTLPARLTRSPAISISNAGPLNGKARFAGRLETVAGFLPAALQSLEGALSVNAAVTGTMKKPAISGAVAIDGGAFTEIATGLSIVNIKAAATASGSIDGTTVSFKASGGGVTQKTETIFADGSFSLGRAQTLRSRIRFDGAKLSAGPVSEVEATGAVDLSGPFDNLLAKGEIAVKSLDARVFTPETTGLVDINVVAVNGDGAPIRQSATVRPATTVNYALRITGDDRIFIRGRGLESEWKADVTIEGRAEAPVVLGALEMRNGDITFAGRRFDMTKGVIAFDRLSANNPALDLRAERETRSGTETAIVIEGRAAAPKISLTSTPALPQEDIMALILFDKPANELSAIESLQVAEGLAELGGIGPFGGNGVTGTARQALGLDLLNVNIDQADSAASSLTVGKYVADGLFVTATQDARGENGSVRIEYEIDNSFTVETELRQDGDQRASVNWKRDF